jgi:CrcB protein
MPNLLFVMIGGAVGAGLRYEAGRLAVRQLGAGFPWGTLAVNLVGALLIGALAGAFGPDPEKPLWLLLAVGVLGGFTTFSAFGLELFTMLGRGQAAMAGLYAGASVLGSLALVAAGYSIARAA